VLEFTGPPAREDGPVDPDQASGSPSDRAATTAR